jgi:hypothetical protein
MRGSWARKVGRFLLVFGVLAVAIGAVGFPLLSQDGRSGLLIAVVIAFGVQLLSTAVLAALRVGTTAYLLARVLAGVFRAVVVVLVVFALAKRDEVDLVVAMVGLVSHLFELLLAEGWILRDSEESTANGRRR